MHARFEGARRVGLECPGGAVSAAVAEGSRLRLLGLMRLEHAEIEPLLFPRCRAIHTHFMRGPIDLVWLEVSKGWERATVAGVASGIRPRSSVRAPRLPRARRRNIAALELPEGIADRLGLTPAAEVAIRMP